MKSWDQTSVLLSVMLAYKEIVRFSKPKKDQGPKTILNHLGNISCQIKYFLTLATNAYDNSNMFPKEKEKYSQFLQGDYIVCYLLSSRSFLKTDGIFQTAVLLSLKDFWDFAVVNVH